MFSKTKYKVIIVYWSFVLFISQGICFEFDQNYFGVVFSPWAKDFSDGIPMKTTYTSKNVKTMLTVASQKFSRFLVGDNFDFYGRYLQNFTYYRGSYVSLYAGEIAARMNQENSNKTLRILYQVDEYGDIERARRDISLAFEAAEKANAIFPGTVEGISLDVMPELERTLNHLNTFRAKATSLRIKFGAQLGCGHLMDVENTTSNNVRHQIVHAADFIICDVGPAQLSLGAANKWPSIETDFFASKYVIGKINPRVEVIGRSVWNTAGINDGETVENLKVFWETASEWAGSNEFKLYFYEAFDNPYQRQPPSSAHRGWWKLRSNSEIDSVDGYIEKAAEMKNPPITSAPSTTSAPPTTTALAKNGATTTSSPEEPIPSTTIKSEKISNDENITKGHEKKVGDKDSSSGSSDKGAVLTITAVIICAILLCNAAIVFKFYRRSKYQPMVEVMTAQDIRDFVLGTIDENNSRLKGSETAVDAALNVPYDNSLEIPKENLKIDHRQELGSGQFGYVFKATIQMDGKEVVEVAVKVAKENCQLPALKGLLSEIKIMTYLGEHPNVVALKGAYTAELSKGCVYVATELCCLGSLESYLRKNHSGGGSGSTAASASNGEKFGDITLKDLNAGITFQEMVRWSCEIACGMEYLEKRQVAHADLATRNVLLSADKTAKITDFGLSRRMYNYMNYVKQNQEPLPWRWMAIESLKRLEFSSKSDVWGYGVTLWEIFSKGDTPYPGLTWTQAFVSRLESGLRPNCPKFASPEIYNTMRDCWNFDPTERPSFSELVDYMKTLSPKTNNEESPSGPKMNQYSNMG